MNWLNGSFLKVIRLLSLEEKLAFHKRTTEMLEDTEFQTVIDALIKGVEQKQALDADTVNFIISAMHVITSQVRARTVGMALDDIRFTPDEMNQKQFKDFRGFN